MSSSTSRTPAAATTKLAALPEGLRRALTTPQIPALDALRAFAALMVIVYHAGVEWWNGGLGVLAFFVLSGFLITWLLLKEWDKYGGIDLGKFYLRRSFRIFPAFYVYWGIAVGYLLILHRPGNWGQAIAAFFYVNNYYQAVNGHISGALSHTWSLGIEEQFYLIWPFALILLMRRGWSLTRALSITILAVWVWRIVLTVATPMPEVWFYEAFDTRLDHLAIGCLMAVMLKSGQGGGLWRRVTARTWLPWVTLTLLGVSSWAQQAYGTTYRNTTAFIVEPVLIAILIVQWMTMADTPGWRWLQWPWLRYLGRISYSTYLYQQLALYSVGRRVEFLGPVGKMLVQIASVIVLASLSYWVVERPFLALKERLGRRKEVMA